MRKELPDESDEKQIKVAKLSEKVYRKWRHELERKVELKHNPIRVKCDQVLKLDFFLIEAGFFPGKADPTLLGILKSSA